MQESPWNRQPRDFIASATELSDRSSGLRWLWIAIAVCSALLLVGWPIPQGVSGGSAGDARAFQLFPGAFTASTSSAGHSVSPATSPGLVVTNGERTTPSVGTTGQSSVAETAATHDLLVRYWSDQRETAQTSKVTVPAAAPRVAANITQPAASSSETTATLPGAPGAPSVAAPAAPAAPSEPIAGVPPQPEAAAVVTRPPAGAFTSRELGLFDAMNEERLARGLPALIAKETLTDVARLRSEEMTRMGYFAHFYSGGTSAYEFLRQAGARFSTAGENLAKVGGGESESVATAIKALMASPTHRANILNPDFARVGVGAVTNDAGITIFTMIYADR